MQLVSILRKAIAGAPPSDPQDSEICGHVAECAEDVWDRFDREQQRQQTDRDPHG